MRLVVCVKQVPDTAAHLEVRGGALTPHLLGTVPEINPFDEFALEEALRLRDLHGGEVVLLSLAREPMDEVIFHGLAMGADRAVVIEAGAPAGLGPRETGAALAAVAGELGPTLVLCGERAVDDDAQEVGSVIAERLAAPQVTAVERIEIVPGGAGLRARCRRGAAVELHASPLPAVVCCIRGDDIPRYPTMDGIFDAGSKPVDVRPLPVVCAMPGAKRVALSAPHEARATEVLGGVTADAIEQLLQRIAARTPVLQ